jgi:hypothetical protein
MGPGDWPRLAKWEVTMAIAATIKKRYGKFSQGPYMKEVVVVELVSDSENKNLVNMLMQNPDYVSVVPVNYDSTSDNASAELSGRQVTIHDGTVGRSYKVEVIGF